MNKTSDIKTALTGIETMLGKISKANGYNSNPMLKQGWLQHIYARRSQVAVTFPLIAYRPELSRPSGGERTNNTNLNDTITFSIDCAVAVKDTETPVDDLLDLLKDVRRSLVFDPYTQKLGISELTFSECPFDVPEAGDEYCFFSQKIQFKVVEQYA